MATSSRLDVLANALDDGVGISLAAHGFIKAKRTVDKSSISLIFRRADSYLQLGASFDHRDAPFTLLCALGVGTHEWPDTDWNKVALWRIVRTAEPHAEESLLAGFSYSAEAGVADFERLSQKCWSAIQRYAAAFLDGDLTLVKKIRAEVNAQREPYKVVSRGPDGSLQSRADQASELLRRKYMQ